jgi:hypothetical protein
MTTASQPAVLDRVAMQMLDSAAHLADAISADVRALVPELEHVDAGAFDALRRGVEQSCEELCGLMRAGFRVAATPPVGAIDNANQFRDSGLGIAAAETALRLALLLFRRAAMPGVAVSPDALGEFDALLSEYWVEHVIALADGYQMDRVLEPELLPLAEVVPGAPAIDAYIRQMMSAGDDAGLASRVGARSEEIVEDFCEVLESAYDDPRVAAKLASAGTSVAIVLADEDDVCATLLLDREPIEIARGTSVAAESEIRIIGADLKRMHTEEFHLAMAMARGRVQWSGPVRKFLRLAPVIGNLLIGADRESAVTG